MPKTNTTNTTNSYILTSILTHNTITGLDSYGHISDHSYSSFYDSDDVVPEKTPLDFSAVNNDNSNSSSSAVHTMEGFIRRIQGSNNNNNNNNTNTNNNNANTNANSNSNSSNYFYNNSAIYAVDDTDVGKEQVGHGRDTNTVNVILEDYSFKPSLSGGLAVTAVSGNDASMTIPCGRTVKFIVSSSGSGGTNFVLDCFKQDKQGKQDSQGFRRSSGSSSSSIGGVGSSSSRTKNSEASNSESSSTSGGTSTSTSSTGIAFSGPISVPAPVYSFSGISLSAKAKAGQCIIGFLYDSIRVYVRFS